MFRTVSSSLLWRGILAIVLGVVAVAWPQITLGAFVILFAVYALTAGVADAVRAFSSEHVGRFIGFLVLGVLSVAAGVVALLWPGMTAVVLTLFVGAWAFVTGVTEVVVAFRRGEPAGERALSIASGVVSIALALVLAVRPDLGAVGLASVFGLFCIVRGVDSIVLASRTRKAEQVAEQAAADADRFMHAA